MSGRSRLYSSRESPNRSLSLSGEDQDSPQDTQVKRTRYTIGAESKTCLMGYQAAEVGPDGHGETESLGLGIEIAPQSGGQPKEITKLADVRRSYVEEAKQESEEVSATLYQDMMDVISNDRTASEQAGSMGTNEDKLDTKGKEREKYDDEIDMCDGVIERPDKFLESYIQAGSLGTNTDDPITKSNERENYDGDMVVSEGIEEPLDVSSKHHLQARSMGTNKDKPSTKGKERGKPDDKMHGEKTSKRSGNYPCSYDAELLGQNYALDCNLLTRVCYPSLLNSTVNTNGVLQYQTKVQDHYLRLQRQLKLLQNIPEPKWDYDEGVCTGWVAWWCNMFGKGQIHEHKSNIVRTIHWGEILPHYGALKFGVFVEYQLNGQGKIMNFWVREGCETVMFSQAAFKIDDYPYMRPEVEERKQVSRARGRARY